MVTAITSSQGKVRCADKGTNDDQATKGGARKEVDMMGDARQFIIEPTVGGEGQRRGDN